MDWGFPGKTANLLLRSLFFLSPPLVLFQVHLLFLHIEDYAADSEKVCLLLSSSPAARWLSVWFEWKEEGLEGSTCDWKIGSVLTFEHVFHIYTCVFLCVSPLTYMSCLSSIVLSRSAFVMWLSQSLVIGPQALTLLKLPQLYNGFYHGSNVCSGINASLYLHLRSQQTHSSPLHTALMLICPNRVSIDPWGGKTVDKVDQRSEQRPPVMTGLRSLC